MEPITWRGAVALFASLALHGIFPIGLWLLGKLPARLLRLPITVTILPSEKLAMLPEAPSPARKPAGPGVRPAAPATGGASKPKAGPGRAAGPPPLERLAGLASDDASVLAVLRMAPLRASPHRGAVSALLAAFPDAAVLSHGTSYRDAQAFAAALIEDLEALLITTTDPYDLRHTTLVGVHREDVDLTRRLSGRTGLSFDGRRLVSLAPGLSAYAPPGDLALLQATDDHAPAIGPERLRGLVAGRAAFSIEVHHVERLARIGDGLPTPTEVHLAASADARPAYSLRLLYLSSEEAAGTLKRLPLIRQRAQERVRWLGLAGLFDDMKARQAGAAVEISGRLPEGETALLLHYLRLMLPSPPMEISRPPDPGSGADGGGLDSGT